MELLVARILWESKAEEAFERQQTFTAPRLGKKWY
jgi:hypothetical protein